MLLAHSATTRSPGTQRLSPDPLPPLGPSGTPPEPPLQRAMLPLLPPRPGEAGKGLRSLRGEGRGWGCSRDQALVSGFAISHSVLMWRVCLNNLTGRLINQTLAFVCRLKAETAIRRNTRSGAARPSLPPASSAPSPSPPCSLALPHLPPLSTACALQALPQGRRGVHTLCLSFPSVASSGSWSSFHPLRKLCPRVCHANGTRAVG